MKIYGQDITLYLLGFDPTVDPKDNVVHTPSYLITGDDLSEYKEWYKSIFGR
jgi:hypothetical protein